MVSYVEIDSEDWRFQPRVAAVCVWRDHRAEVIADRPMLDDPSVAEPEAMDVAEIGRSPGGLDGPDGPGLSPRHSDPRDDLIPLSDEVFDLDVDVRCSRAQPLEGGPQLFRREPCGDPGIWPDGLLIARPPSRG